MTSTPSAGGGGAVAIDFDAISTRHSALFAAVAAMEEHERNRTLSDGGSPTALTSWEQAQAVSEPQPQVALEA